MGKLDNIHLEALYLEMLRENYYLLTEMFVVGSPNIEDNYNFIAYRDKIWIFREVFKDTEPEVLQDLISVFKFPVKNYNSFEVIVDALKPYSVSGYRILVGRVDFESETMFIDNEDLFKTKDKNNSTLVKKVAQELSCRKIEYQNYDTKTDGRIFYHGTASAYLKSILKYGLNANTLNSNFPSIKPLMNGRCFLTSNYNYAKNYAIASALKTKSSSVIISFKVPFYELLEPDYDVKRPVFNDGNVKNPEREAMKLSKEIGVFAYKGNILPNHIETVILTGKTFDSEPVIVPYTVARQMLINMNVSTEAFVKQFNS